MEPVPIISSGMRFSASRIQTLSRNSFQITPQSGTQAISPGTISTFAFPEGANLLDAHSVRIRFRATALTFTPNLKARLPPAYALVQRVEVFAGGVLLDGSCTEHNTVAHIKHLLETEQDENLSYYKTLQNTYMNVTPADANDHMTLIIDGSQLSGFFKASTRYLPVSMMPALSLRLTWADTNVISNLGATPANGLNAEEAAAVRATASPTYVINDLALTIDSLQFSEMYQEMLFSRMRDVGFLPINYRSYYTFLNNIGQSTASTTQFSLATQSLDRIYTVIRDSEYIGSGYPAGKTGDSVLTPAAYMPNCLYFKSLDVSNLLDSTTTHHFTINSVNYPVFSAHASDAMANLWYMCDKKKNLITSRSAWNLGCGIYPLCLNLPDADVYSAATGLDTRGQNATMSFHISGNNGDDGGGSKTVLVACETTSTVKIMVGRNIAVSF